MTEKSKKYHDLTVSKTKHSECQCQYISSKCFDKSPNIFSVANLTFAMRVASSIMCFYLHLWASSCVKCFQSIINVSWYSITQIINFEPVFESHMVCIVLFMHFGTFLDDIDSNKSQARINVKEQM